MQKTLTAKPEQKGKEMSLVKTIKDATESVEKHRLQPIYIYIYD